MLRKEETALTSAFTESSQARPPLLRIGKLITQTLSPPLSARHQEPTSLRLSIYPLSPSLSFPQFLSPSLSLPSSPPRPFVVAHIATLFIFYPLFLFPPSSWFYCRCVYASMYACVVIYVRGCSGMLYSAPGVILFFLFFVSSAFIQIPPCSVESTSLVSHVVYRMSMNIRIQRIHTE